MIIKKLSHSTKNGNFNLKCPDLIKTVRRLWLKVEIMIVEEGQKCLKFIKFHIATGDCQWNMSIEPMNLNSFDFEINITWVSGERCGACGGQNRKMNNRFIGDVDYLHKVNLEVKVHYCAHTHEWPRKHEHQWSGKLGHIKGTTRHIDLMPVARPFNCPT